MTCYDSPSYYEEIDPKFNILNFLSFTEKKNKQTNCGPLFYCVGYLMLDPDLLSMRVAQEINICSIIVHRILEPAQILQRGKLQPQAKVPAKGWQERLE